MKIALDYDNTYTADPVLWNTFIQAAFQQGHQVFIVTARNEQLDKNETLQQLNDAGVRVIYCDGVAKKHIAVMISQHVPDFKIDIWIDDKPESIFQNSAATLEQLVEWRKTRV